MTRTAGNTSTAVMQRRVEPHDSLDDFPTPPWATRALLRYVLQDYCEPDQTTWEPCCNRGYMALPLREYFERVYASDIHDYGWEGQDAVADFLMYGTDAPFDVDWIFANPPFRLAEQFIAKCSQTARRGFAMLVRTSFLEGVGRYDNLFSKNPPSIVAQFAERVPMVKGRYEPDISTATSYCWMVWIDGVFPPRIQWIPQCKSKLFKKTDVRGVLL